MASKIISIKSNCKSRTGPGSSYSVKTSLKKGNKYVYTSKASDKEGKIWYCISTKEYVAASNCTVETLSTSSNSSNSTSSSVSPITSSETVLTESDLDNVISNLTTNKRKQLSTAIDGSVRMFGLPHQLIATNDYRLSSSTNLGVMFTETFILDAPILYIKPGTSNFLPGMSQTQKTNITNAIIRSSGEDRASNSLTAVLSEMSDDDWRYFDFTQKYDEYMMSVNMLCRIGSVFLGLNKQKVPWTSGKTTYGVYDWRKYKFSALYNTKDVDTTTSSSANKKDYAAMVKNVIDNVVNSVLSDNDYVQFYIDAGSSFSESASNSTTQSVISSYTDSLESMGKELSFVSGASGLNVNEFVNSGVSAADNAVNSIASGNGALATFLKRLTGMGKQVLAGSNFLAPEIWDSSDYGKNYSFTITLATPYGTPEAWYLNIFVPLMHILAMALPQQTSANTYTNPYLVKAYSPGWFSCDLGIIDSISIDKGGSGDAWSTQGLPNELKINISIKDLYSNLALPSDYSIKTFFSNTGLINYLMVNCGVDITKQTADDKIAMITNLLRNTLSETVKTSVFEKVSDFKQSIRSALNLYQ